MVSSNFKITELRIEELARLLDIRKHRIETLEQQLRAVGVVEGNRFSKL